MTQVPFLPIPFSFYPKEEHNAIYLIVANMFYKQFEYLKCKKELLKNIPAYIYKVAHRNVDFRGESQERIEIKAAKCLLLGIATCLCLNFRLTYIILFSYFVYFSFLSHT